jgi:hypothetical protein
MKSRSVNSLVVIIVVLLSSLIVVPLFAASDSSSAPTHCGQVLAFRSLKLKQDVDPKAFEKFAAEVYTPTMQMYAPGMKGFFMKGERGKDKGGYVWVLTFDSVQTRDFYYSNEGEGPSDAGGKFLADLPDFKLEEYFLDPEAEDIYTDYIVIGEGYTINGNQVIAFRLQNLKQGVDAKAFEKYTADILTPASLKHAPGMKALVMKGERGEHKGKYVYALTFDSVRTRDFYYPEEGSGLSDAAGKLLANAPNLSLAKYLEDPNTEIDYTDYVLID